MVAISENYLVELSGITLFQTTTKIIAPAAKERGNKGKIG